MKPLRFLNLLFIFLIAFKLSSCQEHSRINPGYDFELFKGTPAYYLAKAVENEDTAGILKFVIKDSIPVDYQETKFGNTLLTLAIVNNKNLSSIKLLDLGANPNTRSYDNSSPFLQACFSAPNLINTRETLLMLIKHGADVNSIQFDTTNDQFGKKKNFSTTALRIACIYGNLESVRVLVENGARLDAYPKNEGAIISTAVLSGNLIVIKYLMIEKKAPIPDYCVIREPGRKNEKKMTITDLLNENDYKGAPDKQKLKQEILDFLKSLGKE